LSAAHSIDQHEPPATAAEVARVTSAALSIPSELVFDRLIDETLGSPIQREQGSTRPRRPDDLSDREIEVLRLIAAGKSNREIAEELFISANTAANHVKSILAKTGSANRAEAATYASRNRLA
jgi:DNA-binding NarL/FixJ family response regulator